MKLFVLGAVLDDADRYPLLTSSGDEGVDLAGIAEAEESVL